MKRRLKVQFVPIFISLCIILSCYPASAAPNSQEFTNDVTAAYQATSHKSIELYQYLLDKIDRAQYGGMYLDAYGRLNIYTTNASSTLSVMSLIDEQVLDNPEVVYHSAKCSYSQLENICNILTDSMQKLGIDSFFIDEKNNCVVVDIVGLTNEKKQAVLADIIDSNKGCIVFDDFNEPTQPSTTISCGSSITDDTAGGYMYTLCCGATWTSGSTTYYGFLTAAHENAVDDVWKYGSTIIGTEKKRQESGSVDAALIARASSSINSTLSFATGSGSITYPASAFISGAFPVGTWVTMYGATTAMSTGTISTVTLTATYDGVTFTNMSQASYSSSGGDSGAPIIVESGTGLVYTYAAGIHGAHNVNGGIFTQMNRAKSALGFTGYAG
jgi:hypothetical protein